MNKRSTVTLTTFIILGIVTYLVFAVITSKDDRSYQMTGQSMIPTYSDGDTIKAEVIPAEEVARGDVIVFTSPLNQEQKSVKRVIGLPGDSVELKEGKITVTTTSGDKYVPYEDSNTSGQDSVVNVEQESFYVVGDNRQPGGSFDSRNEFGLLPFENLLSVAKQ